MKIATWNVNSLRVRLPTLLDWLAQHQPDVLALQETKLTDDKFPLAEIESAGYRAVFAGQKTYNGVALLSKQGADDVISDVPQVDDPDRRILAATFDAVRVLNLYVVNGQEVGSPKYEHKLTWLSGVIEWARAELSQHEKLVIVGDFNIAPEDRDVHDPEAWREKILCSTPERDALARLLEVGFVDSFRLFEQAEASFSWWDYRAAAFRRNMGLRIDLILTSHALAGHCRSCQIDKATRKLERPSDHAPVIAEFEL